MEMKVPDIGIKGKAVLTVLRPLSVEDPVADAYKRVRDATICNDSVAAAMCVSILELIKTELLRGIQFQIDGEM